MTDATVSCTDVLICETHDGGGRSGENVERCGVRDDVVELLNATFVLRAMTGVLANFYFRRGVHPYLDEMVDYGDWDGEFVVGRGILASGRFDEAVDAEPVLALAAIGGVGQFLQLERLADGTKRNLNGASADWSAFPVVALPDPVSESEKEVDAVGVWHVG